MYEDYRQDILDAIGGRKPVAVIEQRKCEEAFKWAWQLARKGVPDITFSTLHLADGHGVKHPALMIGNSIAILKLLKRMRRYQRELAELRASYQVDVGVLLGYEEQDCHDYTRSELSRTCGCEMCGGPTPESVQDNEESQPQCERDTRDERDAHVRRTMYVCG